MSSSTATPEFVLQGVREWLRLACTAAGLADEQVVVADDKGPRPALPYLTVKLTAADVPLGEDEPVDLLADEVTVGTAAAGTEYSLTVNDEDVTYEREDGDTNADVATALASAINNALELVYAEAVDDVLWIAPLHGELTTTTTNPNLTLAEDELPVRGLLGQRAAMASIQSFGLEAVAWLERAAARLAMPDVLSLMEDAGLSIIPTGGMTDLSTLLDTAIEGRRLREFEVTYAVRTEPALLTPLDTALASLELEHREDDPDSYTIEIEAEVS